MNTPNPLDRWISNRLGSPFPLSRETLAEHQLQRLRETISRAQSHSPFYRRLLSGCDAARWTSLEDLRTLPFTSADDLRRNDPPLLCVSQSEISRVVTLDTSGTSGPPKRLYFTQDEQEATIDFFHHGMSVLARPDDRVLILFPCERPGGIGDLLATALLRLGATPITAGPVRDIAATLQLMADKQPTVVAGLPVHVRALARCGHAAGTGISSVRTVLLSADHIAARLAEDLRQTWNCEVFEHYGMTEMGLGGGVDCGAHMGYHVREADLLFEIVDPTSGKTLPDGEIGEIVVTTLTRRGMPLVRYRTGDFSRFIPGSCPCGSALRRLEHVRLRLGGAVPLGESTIAMDMLDEALFAIDEVTDFSVTLRHGSPTLLQLVIGHPFLSANAVEATLTRVRAALLELPPIHRKYTSGTLQIQLEAANAPLCTRTAKRAIAIEA